MSKTETISSASPLVSICIPTYNRATFISNLFESLHLLKISCGDAVEICISNNNSSDNTSDLINQWQSRLNLKAVTQAENIGANRNCIEVTKLASGKWIHMVGDDDTLLPANYLILLEILKTTKEETWILAGVDGENNSELYLGGLTKGCYAANAFKRVVLKTGLARYSFMGQHIFPSMHLPDFHNRPLNSFIPWFHLGLFLSYLAGCGEVLIWPRSVVKQKGGGAALFWRADDWANVHLRRLYIIRAAKRGGWRRSWFYDALILREMYGLVGLKVPMSWKIREPITFNEKAAGLYINTCFGFGLLSILTVPYILFVLFLRIMPLQVLYFSPFRNYFEKVRNRYILEKENLSKFDGMERKV